MAAARHVWASDGPVGDRDVVLKHGLCAVTAHDDQAGSVAGSSRRSGLSPDRTMKAP